MPQEAALSFRSPKWRRNAPLSPPPLKLKFRRAGISGFLIATGSWPLSTCLYYLDANRHHPFTHTLDQMGGGKEIGGLHFDGWILRLHGWMLDGDENRKICKSLATAEQLPWPFGPLHVAGYKISGERTYTCIFCRRSQISRRRTYTKHLH